MGSAAHLVVVGGPDDLAARAEARLRDLESRWSRFLPDSEVSRFNAAPDEEAAAIVSDSFSDETRRLFEVAAHGARITGGRFDPYQLQAVTDAGYRTPLGSDGPPMAPQRGFDPGGIGKGLAADIVSAELGAAGADGVLVGVGGDLRVRGAAPDGGPWRIDVEDPRGGEPVAAVVLADGAVATSSRMKRRWTAPDGTERHHLIEPSTLLPAGSPVLSATVVAGEGWQAEVLTKVAFLDAFGDGALSSDAGLALVESLGAAALVVTDDLVLTTSRWSDFAAPREEAR
jgi:thiamine biosynthesis lipoprotein